jgi:hypothetical protein
VIQVLMTLGGPNPVTRTRRKENLSSYTDALHCFHVCCRAVFLKCEFDTLRSVTAPGYCVVMNKPCRRSGNRAVYDCFKMMSSASMPASCPRLTRTDMYSEHKETERLWRHSEITAGQVTDLWDRTTSVTPRKCLYRLVLAKRVTLCVASCVTQLQSSSVYFLLTCSKALQITLGPCYSFDEIAETPLTRAWGICLAGDARRQRGHSIDSCLLGVYNVKNFKYRYRYLLGEIRSTHSAFVWGKQSLDPKTATRIHLTLDLGLQNGRGSMFYPSA